MSEHALDIHLEQQDRAYAEDTCWCQWGRHWVPAESMPSEHALACKACDAAFRKDNEEVEQMFVETFGGEL